MYPTLITLTDETRLLFPGLVIAVVAAVRAEVVREDLKLALAGAVLGSVAFTFSTRFLRSLLFEVSAAEGSVWMLTLAAVGAVAAAACAGPSLRAASFAPAEALKRV